MLASAYTFFSITSLQNADHLFLFQPFPDEQTFKENLLFRNFCQRLGNGLVVSSTPATEETGAMGREIETRLDVGWKLKKTCALW
jgi:hypothetical protein